MTEQTQADTVTNDILFCVGCGSAVCRSYPGQLLAISCRCGAYAPILRGPWGFSAPASLVLRRPTKGVMPEKLPHLEYYLGYSDHESKEKAQAIRELRGVGAISQAECPEQECQEAYQRGRQRWQETLGRQENSCT